MTADQPQTQPVDDREPDVPPRPSMEHFTEWWNTAAPADKLRWWAAYIDRLDEIDELRERAAEPWAGAARLRELADANEALRGELDALREEVQELYAGPTEPDAPQEDPLAKVLPLFPQRQVDPTAPVPLGPLWNGGPSAGGPTVLILRSSGGDDEPPPAGQPARRPTPPPCGNPGCLVHHGETRAPGVVFKPLMSDVIARNVAEHLRALREQGYLGM